MSKTRLYLDVDGVLNAWDAHEVWGFQNQDTASPSFTFTIIWAPRLIEALNELDVEIVWLTTWEDEANKWIKPMMGLKGGASAADLRVLGRADAEGAKLGLARTEGSVHWKYHALMADQKRDPSPFIWVDDEVGDYSFYSEPYKSNAENIGGLVIAADAKRGITPDNIQNMQDYIRETS